MQLTSLSSPPGTHQVPCMLAHKEAVYFCMTTDTLRCEPAVPGIVWPP